MKTSKKISFLYITVLCISISLVAMAQPGIAATNLVTDASGESGFTGWTAASGVTLNSTFDSTLSQNVAKISGSISNTWSFVDIQSVKIPLTGGAIYRLECWMKADALSRPDLSPYLRLGVYNGSKKWIANCITQSYDIAAMGQWQKLWWEFKVDSTAAYGVLSIQKSVTDAMSATMYVYGVSLTKLDSYSAIERAQLSPEPSGLAQFTTTRPRLYLDDAKIESLKNKLSTYPYSKFWKSVSKKAYSYLSVSAPSTLSGDFRSYGDRLLYLSIVYLLTGDETYLEYTRSWMNALCSFSTWGDDTNLNAAHLLIGMSIAYDWLHDHFTDEERRTYRAKITHQAEVLYDAVYYRQVWWAKDYLHNQNYRYFLALGVAGLTLYGETDEAESYIAMARTNFTKVLSLLSPDGACPEGIGYWGYATDALLSYFYAMKPLYGISEVVGNDYFKNTALFRLYASTPDYAENVDYSDSATTEWYGPGYILRALASVFGDGRAQWLAETIETARGDGALYSWQDLLWYDETVSTKSPEDLPTSASFDNFGIVISRTNWTKDCVWTFFKAGPTLGKLAEGVGLSSGVHIHPDLGNFMIWAYGNWLVVDDGYVDVKYTKNHNLCLFNQTGELSEGGTESYRASVHLIGGVADLTYFSNASDCVYAVADLSNIYSSSLGVNSYQRAFIVLKNGYVLVRDEIALASASSISSRIHFGDGPLGLVGGRYVYTGSSSVLAVNTFSTDSLTYSATSFSIPATEQHYEGFGHYSGKLLTADDSSTTSVVTVHLLRPGYVGKVPADLTLQSFIGGKTLYFDDGALRAYVDFSGKKVTYLDAAVLAPTLRVLSK